MFLNHVSVIVLTYNQEEFIEQNLLGIFMQEVNFTIELIISDDHSKDKTDSVIQNILTNTPSHITVKYTSHKNNLGSTPNFYDALSKVTGKYLAFCEGDDYWTDKNKLQKQYDFLEQDPDYAMCFHQVINVSPDEKINQTLFANVEDRDYTAEEIYKHWLVHTTSVFMRSKVLNTKVFQTMKMHPDLLYFDTILYMGASLIGKIKGVSETWSAYRRHEAGLSNGINFKRDIKHNKLDEIIASIYGGKIKEYSNWLIFSRSRTAFKALIQQKKYRLAYEHLKWIFRKKSNLMIYLKKKYL